jgi:hypothetical protein
MIYSDADGRQDQSKADGVVGVMRRKKSLSSPVIEKTVCDNPCRCYGL